jgi:Bacterial Ig domain
MTNRRWIFGFTSMVTLTLLAALPAPAQQSQLPLPLDRKALFRTVLPHLNAKTHTGGGGTSPAATQTAASATFTQPPYQVGPAVAATTTAPAAEQHIFVDPTNPSVLVGAISDFSWAQRDIGLGAFNTTKYTFSGDGGANWTEAFVPTVDLGGYLALTTSDGYVWDANSDPVLAIDKHGRAYLASLYFDAFAISNGYYVLIGSVSPSGLSFPSTSILPIVTNPDLSGQFFEDKPWLAVDNSDAPSTTGNVYACWSHFINATQLDFIAFSRSQPGGLTWSPMQRITPAEQDGAVQGCQVATGPGGEVYITYEVYYVGGKRQQWLAKSTDGGQNFSAPVAITPLFDELSFNSTYRKFSLPSLAVNPVTGYIYVVYADQVANGGAEIEFVRSTTPGGTTFTSPVTLNDSPAGQQFFPAVTAASDGLIHVTWFDTRNGGGNTSLYDVYATYSPDNGTTFAVNARVTPTTIDAAGSGFIGDYTGIAAAGGVAHPVWTNGSMQTAALTLGGTPSNTAPTAEDHTVTTNEDTPVVLPLSASDAEQCNLQFSIVSAPSHGALGVITNAPCTSGSPNTDTATVTYTPNANFNGSDSFTYGVSDGSLADAATVSITVSPVNDAPVAANSSVSTVSATPVVVTLSASDPDGCAPLFSFTVVTSPANGLLSGMTSVSCVSGTHTTQVTYTPNGGFVGPDSFTYQASDGVATSNVATVAITVTSPPSGEVTVTSIQPNIVSRNAGVVNFTITGTGFALGASVTFENGTGPVPRVNGVTWNSSTQLTASVEIRRGGPRRNRLWDVRVTNPDGSTGVGAALLQITP